MEWGCYESFLIEARIFISSTFIIYSNKIRETCVRIGYFIHSGVYIILTKLFTGTRVSKDFQFRVYLVAEMTEYAQLTAIHICDPSTTIFYIF